MINNIGFLSFMLLIYLCVKYFYPKNAKLLFHISSWMQIFGLCHFIIMLAFPHFFGSVSLAEWVSQKYLIIHETHFYNLLPLLGVLYCFILFFLIVKTSYQLYSVQKMKNNADYSQSSYFNNLISTHTPVAIGLSKEITSPITFGWWSPIILLPFSICNQLTILEVETILLHELAHILRNDYIMHLILTLVQTILFFNPIIYLFKKETSLQREIACDLYVVNSKSIHKLDYMNALYKLASVTHSVNHPTTMGVLSSQNELLTRMKQLSNSSYVSFKNIWYKIFLFSLIGLVIVLSTLNLSVYKSSTTLSMVPNETTSIKVEFKNDNKINKKSRHIHQKQVIKKLNGNNAGWANTNKNELHHHHIEKESYSNLVKQTVQWIKLRQGESYFASFDESEEDINYTVAEKLLMRAILSNYQLKRDILNNKLSKALDQQEAIDTLLNSKEFAEMKQFEKWTKEFLKQHPTEATAPIVY